MNEIQVKKHSFTKYCTVLLKKALFPFNRKEWIQDIFLHLYMKRATYAPAVIPQEKISRVQGTCKATPLAGLLLASAVHFLCKEGIGKNIRNLAFDIFHMLSTLQCIIFYLFSPSNWADIEGRDLRVACVQTSIINFLCCTSCLLMTALASISIYVSCILIIILL